MANMKIFAAPWLQAIVDKMRRARETAESLVHPGFGLRPTSEALEQALNRVVRNSLRPTAAGLMVLYILLGISHLLVTAEPTRMQELVAAWGTAVFFFGLYWLFTWRTIPPHWAHPIGFLMAVVTLFNSLFHSYLTSELPGRPGILFVVVGIGLLFLSLRWFLLGLGLSLLAWVGVVWGLPAFTGSIHFAIDLFISVLLAGLAFGIRRQGLERYERLRQQEQQSKQELHRLYQHEQAARRVAETMYQTSSTLTGTLEWAEVLNLILGHLENIVPYDRAAVLVRQGQELAMVAARGFPASSQPTDIRIALNEGESIFKEIYETKRPLSISDVLQRPDWQQVDNLPQARTWLGIPLIHAHEVVGMLSLTRETVASYSEGQIALATAFAGQAAIALRNANLYSQLNRFNHQLEYEVQQRTQALQEAYERLEKLDRTKSDFLSITSHELRTPLTVLKGYSQMLLKDRHIQENERHHRLLSGILAGSERMEEIVNSMLDLVKIDSRALELYPEPVSVPALIQLLGNKFEKVVTERQQSLQITEMLDMPAIEADPEALQKVFYHLIINAIKYTPDGGSITISGGALARKGLDLPEEGVEIVVSDTGIGIDVDVQELIFTKFYQPGRASRHSSGKTSFKGGGPGLGLAIARGIVEAHRGKLWVESSGHNEQTYPGSHFHVVLPLRQDQ